MDRINVQTEYPEPTRGLVPSNFYADDLDEDIQTEYTRPEGALTPSDWHVGEWSIDFEETPLFEQYETHVDEGMELMVLVSDWLARRGTGKTTLSIRLADKFDRTNDGLTPEKTTNSPEQFIDAYVEHSKGSGLVFDEAESGVNARDAMTTVNKQMNEKVSVGRVGEKYSVWNMPDVGQIDKEVQKLAHLWILVTRKGRARAYALDYNPFEQQNYPTPLCELEWDAIDQDEERLKQVFDALHEVKWESLRDEEDEFVPMPEHRKEVDRAEEEAKREKRNELIFRLRERDLLPNKEIADIVELDPSAVSKIYNDMVDNRGENH